MLFILIPRRVSRIIELSASLPVPIAVQPPIIRTSPSPITVPFRPYLITPHMFASVHSLGLRFVPSILYGLKDHVNLISLRPLLQKKVGNYGIRLTVV